MEVDTWAYASLSRNSVVEGRSEKGSNFVCKGWLVLFVCLC